MTTSPRSGRRAKSHYALVVETASSGSTPGERRAPPARYEIAARETIIGRAPACAIRIDDAFVSREHARLLLRDLDLHLEDLGSTNETRLDGALVETRVRVRQGSELRLGSAVCRIEGCPSPPGRKAAAPGESSGPSEAGPPPVAERRPMAPGADTAPRESREPDEASHPGEMGLPGEDPIPRESRELPAGEALVPGNVRRLGPTPVITLVALVAALVLLLVAGALWISWR